MTDPAIVKRLTAKAKWAKEHIEKLQTTLRSFPALTHNADELIRFEDNLHARERTYYIASVPDVPAEAALIAGDALHNIRSALDHLVCHLVRIGPGPEKVGRLTALPIADSAQEYNSPTLRRKIAGMRPEAKEMLGWFHPYKGGDYLLWELHELNKIDKHRLLLTACAVHRGHSMPPSERAILEQQFRESHPGRPDITLRHMIKEVDTVPLKVGEKLLTIAHAEMEQDMKFYIDVAFDEPKIVKSDPVVQLLSKMADIVLIVISSFDQAGYL